MTPSPSWDPSLLQMEVNGPEAVFPGADGEIQLTITGGPIQWRESEPTVQCTSAEPSVLQLRDVVAGTSTLFSSSFTYPFSITQADDELTSATPPSSFKVEVVISCRLFLIPHEVTNQTTVVVVRSPSLAPLEYFQGDVPWDEPSLLGFTASLTTTRPTVQLLFSSESGGGTSLLNQTWSSAMSRVFCSASFDLLLSVENQTSADPLRKEETVHFDAEAMELVKGDIFGQGEESLDTLRIRLEAEEIVGLHGYVGMRLTAYCVIEEEGQASPQVIEDVMECPQHCSDSRWAQRAMGNNELLQFSRRVVVPNGLFIFTKCSDFPLDERCLSPETATECGFGSSSDCRPCPSGAICPGRFSMTCTQSVIYSRVVF